MHFAYISSPVYTTQQQLYINVSTEKRPKHKHLVAVQHCTYNMKSCSQQGWSPRTATVVLFTFCTFRVTYVLNLSGEQKTKCYLLQYTLSSHKHNISGSWVTTLQPRATQNQKPIKIYCWVQDFFTCHQILNHRFLEIHTQTKPCN